MLLESLAVQKKGRIHNTVVGDVKEQMVRPIVNLIHTEGGDDSCTGLQGVQRLLPTGRGTHRVDGTKAVQLHEKEEVTPSVHAIRKSFEQSGPCMSGNKHVVPIRAYRKNMEPVEKQVDCGHKVTFHAEGLECEDAIHNSWGKLGE